MVAPSSGRVYAARRASVLRDRLQTAALQDLAAVVPPISQDSPTAVLHSYTPPNVTMRCPLTTLLIKPSCPDQRLNPISLGRDCFLRLIRYCKTESKITFFYITRCYLRRKPIIIRDDIIDKFTV